jgi:hypothetical protein
MLTLAYELALGLDKGKRFDLAILDFSKAFDRVPHCRLLSKLSHYGVRGSSLAWIRSFLTGRTQKVIVEGIHSDEVPVVSGVPQGSVLGPLLFLVFINVLPECVSSSTRLFADDCIVYRAIESAEDSKNLQDDLKELEKWEKKWGMDFHPEKCNILHVTRSRASIEERYFLKNHQLEMVDCAKYLGIDIDQQLTWNNHINRIVKKANSMLGFVKRNLQISNTNTKADAYKALVRSNLEYCCSVWAPHTAKNNKS